MSEEHINHLKEFDQRVSEEWRQEFAREARERRRGTMPSAVFVRRYDREGIGVHGGGEEEERERQEGEEEEGKTGGKAICMARLPARKPFGRLVGQPHGRRDHGPTFYALLVVAWLVIVGSLLLLVTR